MEASGRRKPGSQHTARYRKMCAELKAVREKAGLTQRELAAKLKWFPSQVAKAETGHRRIDPVELVDWCRLCGAQWDAVMKTISPR